MEDAEKPGVARLAIIGDVMLGRLVSREIGRRAPESFWGDTLPVLRAADAVIANLECAISDCGKEWRRTPKTFHFRANPDAIAVLQAANVSYVSLANNHVLDYGERALSDTLALLDAAGIAHAGAGINAVAARKPARFEAGGLQIAAFSVTDNEPSFAATDARPGTCHLDTDETDWPEAAAIRAERRAGADLVLVSAHMGPNMVNRPYPELRAYKQRLVAAGCDVVHGHSAHLFQGVEIRDRRVILHDTGDFLDDYAIDEVLHNDWSFLFLLDVDAAGVRRLELLPVHLRFAEVNLASGTEADAICDRMRRLSADFGVELSRTEDGLELLLGR